MKSSATLLPGEICYIILDYLALRDWLRLRLVSREWSSLSHRIMWTRVAVVPSPIIEHGSVDMLMVGIDGIGIDYDLRNDFIVINYEELKDLDPKFRAFFSNYTTELYIRFSQCGGISPGEDTFELLLTIFKNVKKIKLSCKIGRNDKRLQAFQALLDKWSPFVEFSLGFDAPRQSNGHINISKMTIKEIHISETNVHIGRISWPIGPPPLTIGNRTPVKWTDFPSLCTSLTSLTLGFACSSSWQWIPDSVRSLHICNLDGWFKIRPRLVVPGGVEYLQVSDVRYTHVVTTHPKSAVKYIDLSEAKGLKTFLFVGKTTSEELITRISEVGNSLERFYIKPINFSGNNWVRRLIGHCEAVKTLRLPVSASGICNEALPDSLKSFRTLPQLQMLFLDFDYITGRREITKAQFMENVVAEFLKACPNLFQMTVKSVNSDLPPMFISKSWVISTADKTVSCTVDISKARKCLL